MTMIGEEITVTKQERDFYTGAIFALATIDAFKMGARMKYSKIDTMGAIEEVINHNCERSHPQMPREICTIAEINRAYNNVHARNEIKRMVDNAALPSEPAAPATREAPAQTIDEMINQEITHDDNDPTADVES
jgi:hypothetical protein